MKERTIGKEVVSIGKMGGIHPLVNQLFITNRYKNGPFNRGFWNPGYKMLGERAVPQLFVTRRLQNVGSKSWGTISMKELQVDIDGTRVFFPSRYEGQVVDRSTAAKGVA